MKRAKEQVTATVKEYIRLFPKEYDAFLSSTRAKQHNLIDEFAEMKGSEQMVRHLFDLPETLHYALQRALTDEEYDWLYSRGQYERRREGLSWFIKAFPQFKITSEW